MHRLTWLSAILLSACIPSLRVVHDGNRYFERCYGADFDPRIPEAEKELCWQAWLAHYTRHQPAQRVDYAMRRVEALMAGEPAPVLPGVGDAQPNVAPSPEIIAELGTLHGAAATSQAPASEKPPGVPNGCFSACNAFEHDCVAICSPDDGECRRTCSREREICLGGCH